MIVENLLEPSNVIIFGDLKLANDYVAKLQIFEVGVESMVFELFIEFWYLKI